MTNRNEPIQFIAHEYDPETQKSINKLQEHITSIGKQYESKLHPNTAIECLKVSRPEYQKAIIKEYKEEIKPFQNILKQIYLTSVPNIIIKRNKKVNNLMKDNK